jgi:hypothetical protein
LTAGQPVARNTVPPRVLQVAMQPDLCCRAAMHPAGRVAFTVVAAHPTCSAGHHGRQHAPQPRGTEGPAERSCLAPALLSGHWV